MPRPPRIADGIGARLAFFLRARYPQHRAKTLARTFGVSISTAQRWLDGYPPTIRHFEQMYEEWGQPLIRTVFPACFDGISPDDQMEAAPNLEPSPRPRGAAPEEDPNTPELVASLDD